MRLDPIDPVRSAFDHAQRGGRVIDLWWRDDDAVRATPALDRLLALSARYRAPIALAAIPAAVERSLVERLRDEADIHVLPHGYRHTNHAPPGAKAAEFGAHRAMAVMEAEIAVGWRDLHVAFGAQALGIFVPPWNRMTPDLAARLPALGLAGWSGFGSAAGGPKLHTDLDPVDWRGGRSLAPSGSIAAMLCKALDGGATRLGYLTHHLVFDDALWAFCESLLALAASHPAVRLRTLSSLDEATPWPLREGRETVRQTRSLCLADGLT